MTRNTIRNAKNRAHAQAIIDRLIQLGWQNVSADEDFFAGVTGTYANLQIDFVFDETGDHFARISVRSGAEIGKTLQSWSFGQVQVALRTPDLMAAPTQRIDDVR